MNPLSSCSRVLVAAFFMSSLVFAHVTLLSPNGGQVFAPGQATNISWTPSPGHNTVNWHLYYSTTGPNGPWIPIALNLPPTNILTGEISNFAWTLPNTLTTSFYIRIVQDNTGTDYDDVNDAPIIVAASLQIDAPSVSIVAPALRTFSFDAGVARAFDIHWLLGSVTGTMPGFTYQTSIIPLNVDFYFDLTVMLPNVPPLVNSLGNLDGLGQATMSFDLPIGLPPTLAGFVIHHAAVAISATGISFVSNAVPLTLLP